MDSEAIHERVKLGVVEVLDRGGRARVAVPVWRWPVMIGRAVDSDIVLDDPFVAAHHASLDLVDGRVVLHAGESLNGAQISRRRLGSHESAELIPGAEFQVGATTLRVRLASDAVAAERPLTREQPERFLSLSALVAAFTAWNLAERWIQSEPDGRMIHYLSPLIGSPLFLAMWSAFWSLGSRLFRQRFDYWRHLRIAALYLTASSAIRLFLPVLAYALGWSFLSRVVDYAALAIACAMVVAHLTLILPSRRRILRISVATLFVAAVTLMLTWNYQVHKRLFEELYVSTLVPPILRVTSPVTVGSFMEEARGMRSALDSRVNDDETNDGYDDEDE